MPRPWSSGEDIVIVPLSITRHAVYTGVGDCGMPARKIGRRPALAWS